MMKQYKLICVALVAVAPIALSSCLFEQDDFFDESPALRIEHFNEEAKEILCTAEHGWIMQYFPNTTSIGYNMFCDFNEDLSVTVGGTHSYMKVSIPAGQTYATSMSCYSLLQDDGPVLSFHTWNDVLTVFANPINPTTGEVDGEGLKGDYNFNIRKLSADEIMLNGSRYAGTVRLIPAQSSWADYIAAVNKTKKDLSNPDMRYYYLTNGEDTVYVSTSFFNGTFTQYDRIVDPLLTDVSYAVLTDKGLRLQNDVNMTSVADVQFREFFVNEDSTALVADNENVSLIPMWDTYIADLPEFWQLDTTQLNDEISLLLDEVITEFEAAGFAVAGIGYGYISSKVFGLGVKIYTNAAQTRNRICGVEMLVSRDAMGQLSIVPNTEVYDTNMSNIVKKSPKAYEAFCRLAEKLEGQYTVTPDNYFQPTGAHFSSSNGLELYFQ